MVEKDDVAPARPAKRKARKKRRDTVEKQAALDAIPRDRAATEALLGTAALALLREHGLLAGLNLRQVAEKAGVNRGLVYHYFGSRRDLLRATLRREGLKLSQRVRALKSDLRFIERMGQSFRMVMSFTEGFRLVTMLILDGDNRVKLLPFLENYLALLRLDQERGDLRPDTDVEALHVLLVAQNFAYALFRERFAAELHVPVSQLDERVSAQVDRLLEASVLSAHQETESPQKRPRGR